MQNNNQVFLSHYEVDQMAAALAVRINRLGRSIERPYRVYPIPRGGVAAAYALKRYLTEAEIVDHPKDATLFIDDIIDSGATMQRYCDAHPGTPFFALIDKTEAEPDDNRWFVFLWEVREDGGHETAEDNIVRLLQAVGEDPARGGLLETPARVIKAWGAFTAGYGQDPADVLKVFEDGGEGYDEMVVVRDIPFYSNCEHHMVPFFGTATIAYIPDGKIVGLSKLSRLLDVFARRLQVQERLTAQVADAIMQHLGAKGAGVVVKARHLCMESRGVCKQGHHTITSALRGVMKTQADTRAEFMDLAK